MQKQGIVLVALGDKSLADFVQRVKEDPEEIKEMLEAVANDVPHYRTGTSCDQNQIETFVEFMGILKEFIGDNRDE